MFLIQSPIFVPMRLSVRFLLCIFLFGFTFVLSGQDAYWVFYKDKEVKPDVEYIDLEVNKKYVQALLDQGIDVIGSSKWLNASCVVGNTSLLVEADYIQEIRPLGKYNTVIQSDPFDTSTYGSSDIQLRMLGLDKLHAMGYTGKGVKLALFDAGYYGIDTFSCFKKLWEENRIADHYDFVLDRPLNFDQSNHGAYVLSIAGGRCDDSLVGAAPEATFYLARTEESSKETHLEEYYWTYALEWAVENEVDIIHSSLGYSRFDTLQGDYTYADMDGETTIITQATQVAISKGIFVTNSAGNEGDKDWRYITAPCDGKNVLCVGAVDSFRNYARFSSVGPSADRRVKPEVMAMGEKTSYQDKSGRIMQGNGTSFSGPLIAGMVACLMEANPKAYNSQIFDAIVKSADRFENPDSFYGYGIPNAVVADSLIKEMVLSMGKLVRNDFEVFPNPGKNRISVVSSVAIKSYRMYNALGIEVLNENLSYNLHNYGISTDELGSGVYLIAIYDDKGSPYFTKWVRVN